MFRECLVVVCGLLGTVLGLFWVVWGLFWQKVLKNSEKKNAVGHVACMPGKAMDIYASPRGGANAPGNVQPPKRPRSRNPNI